MKKVICNFCENESNQIYVIKRFKKPFTIWKCKNCHLIFQFPQPENIEQFYDEGYYTGQNNFSYQDERNQFKFYSYVWKSRVKKIKKNIRSNSKIKKILDIGCSFGGLLENAKNLKFDTFGLEISDFSRSYARNELKHKVYKNFQEANFNNNYFDAITMIEVIEHLDDPVHILKKIFQKLKKGGLFVIQTANMNGMQAKKQKENYHYFLPGHLFYFSKKNLVEELKKIGFKKVKVFIPVEFGLIRKLQKSRGNFKKLRHYLKWIRIIYYHLKSKIKIKDFCLTSSMVIYAWK